MRLSDSAIDFELGGYLSDSGLLDKDMHDDEPKSDSLIRMRKRLLKMAAGVSDSG